MQIAEILGEFFQSVRSTLRKWGQWLRRLIGADSLAGSLAVGRRGERLAGQYLQRLGWRVVARNVRTPFGELDVVAWNGRAVVFVEVKSRCSTAEGLPPDPLVAPEQVARIVHAARWYRRRHALESYPARHALCVVTWGDRWSARVELFLDPWEEDEVDGWRPLRSTFA